MAAETFGVEVRDASSDFLLLLLFGVRVMGVVVADDFLFDFGVVVVVVVAAGVASVAFGVEAVTLGVLLELEDFGVFFWVEAGVFLTGVDTGAVDDGVCFCGVFAAFETMMMMLGVGNDIVLQQLANESSQAINKMRNGFIDVVAV